MKITVKQLTALNACAEGKLFVKKQKDKSLRSLVYAALGVSPAWVHWLLVRLMTCPQRVIYAVHSAELSLEHFETQFPKDDRPRKAIEAAKMFALNPTEQNREAAESAARSAWSAAWSAESAESAAWSAARSAESAARSAGSAAWSAERSAAWSAERSAAWSAANKNIAEYGLFLLGE